MTHREFLERISQYSNYIIIAVASIISVFFFPFVGSELGLALTLPDTTAGWIVFVGTKLWVAFINILIFHCFVSQARLNIKENKRYLEAEEIMLHTATAAKPLSPQQFFVKEYSVKGSSVFIVSVLSAFSLAQAVLTFDLLMMLSYLFTIIMGLIAGFIEMKKVEEYWTIDYLNYAKEYRRQVEEKEKIAAERALAENQESTIASDTTGGTDVLVAPDNNGDTCPAD